MAPEQQDPRGSGGGDDPLPDQHGPVDLRLLAAALTDALQRSGWYDPACPQDGLYQWAATDLSVGMIRAWLGADIANPGAVGFRELGIGPQKLRGNRHGEQVSIGRLSVDEAARTILGPRAAGGLDQLRAAFRSRELAGTEQASRQQAARHFGALAAQELTCRLDDEFVTNRPEVMSSDVRPLVSPDVKRRLHPHRPDTGDWLGCDTVG